MVQKVSTTHYYTKFYHNVFPVSRLFLAQRVTLQGQRLLSKTWYWIGKYDQEKSLFYMWSHSFRFDTWSVWIWHNPESLKLIFQPYKNCSVSDIEHLGPYICLDVGFWNVSSQSSNNALSKSDVSWRPLAFANTTPGLLWLSNPHLRLPFLFDKWSIVIVSKGERIV